MGAMAYWLPPVLLMAAVLLLSSDAGGAHVSRALLASVVERLWPGATPAQIDTLHVLLRKLGHFLVYALLAALWFRALATGRHWRLGPAAAAALAIAIAWALLDEGHQTLAATRTGSLADVALDTAGALTAVAAAWLGSRAAAGAAMTLLLAAAVTVIGVLAATLTLAAT
jgi:VanZ family protein